MLTPDWSLSDLAVSFTIPKRLRGKKLQLFGQRDSCPEPLVLKSEETKRAYSHPAHQGVANTRIWSCGQPHETGETLLVAIFQTTRRGIFVVGSVTRVGSFLGDTKNMSN